MEKNIQIILGILLLLFTSTQSHAQDCGNEITRFEVTNVTNASCFGGQDGSISVKLSGGQAPFVYELWVDQGGSGNTKLQESPSTPDTEHTFTNLFAESILGGNYFTVVKTSNVHTSGNATLTQLCSERQLPNIDLTNPDQMVNSVDLVTPSCAGNDGEILLTTTGGTTPYTYTWTSVPAGQAAIGNTNNPTGLIPGDYTVEIVDVNNCPLAGFGGPIVENITIAASPVVIDQTPAVCEDAQGTGQASGLDLIAFEPAINSEPGTTTTWYNNYDGTTVSNAVADPTSVAATNGQQFFAEVDNGSCQSVATVTYTVNPYPSDPSNVQVTGVGCNEFTANWDESTDAVDYVVNVVRESDNAGVDTRTVADNTPQLFNSLTTYETYHFTVVARNACGESSIITSASFTTDGIPPVPAGLTVNNVVCDGFDAVWDAVANATRYTVVVYTDPGLTNLLTSQTLPAPATPTVSTTFSGLSLGTTYYFHVRAENDCGNGEYSPAETVTTDDVPTDPTNVVAQNISCTAFDATWSPVPNATGYVVEIIDAGGDFATPNRTESVAGTSFPFTGLTAGLSYQFRVRAQNVCGESNNVTSAVISTNATPAVPTGLASSNVLCTSFDAQWNAVGDANSYTLEVYEEATLTTLVTTENVLAPATTFRVENLDIGSTYYYRIRSTGDCGDSEFSPAVVVTTDNVPTTPASPQAINIGCTTFDAQWTASTNADEYVVEVIDVDAGATFAAPTFSNTVAATETIASFTGLTAGKQYQFRVRATNSCGESNNVVSSVFDTDALPAIPSGLIATATCTALTAEWNTVSDASNYTIEVYNGPGLNVTDRVAMQNVAVTTATFNTLTEGTTYYFQVRAENTCGESNFSATETIATDALPAAPTSPTTSAPTCTSFQANWTASVSGVDDYTVELIDVTAGTSVRTETVAATETGFLFSGLTADNEYQFVVRATNDCGDSGDATSPVASTGTPPIANDQTPSVCEDSPGNGAVVNLTALQGAIDGGANHTITWFEDVSLTQAIADPTTVTVNNDDFFAQVDDGTCQTVATVTYTVTPVPDATVSYASGTFCLDAESQSPTVATGGGTFSADAGLAIDPATGVIDVANSTPAPGSPYTVTYELAGTCPNVGTFEVTITDAPNAEFEYDLQYCQEAGLQLPRFTTGGSGGQFSSNPATLAIDAGTGEINPATSAPGFYIITNTIAANGSCPETTDQFSVEILEQDDATFSYAASYCQDDATDPVANITGDAGAFSALPAGLVFLDASTGEIDLDASAANTYTITYTTNASACTASSSVEVVIDQPGDPSFSYNNNVFCPSDANPVLTISGDTGGEFSVAPAGLNLDSTSGAIDLATSAAGAYVITYETGGDCQRSATFDMTINAVPTANDQTPTVCEDAAGSGSATVNLELLDVDGGAGHLITWFEDAALAQPIATPSSVTATNGDDFFARVDNGTCQNVATVTYTVNPAPTVSDQTPTECEDAAGSGSATVDLTAQQAAVDGANGYSFSWFEDAALTQPVADPTLVVVSSGDDFFAQVENGSCQSIATVTYAVQASPTVTFTGLASPYCTTDGAVLLEGSANPDGTFTGPGVADQGNGTATFDPAVGPGTYTITYTYSDGSGCNGQSSQTVVVNDCTTEFTPNFTADVTSICEGETVRFENQSSGAITGYDWNFGTGATPATATGPGPHTVSYSTIGTATVSLTVDGPTTETKAGYITINGPDDAGFRYDVAEYCPDGTNPVPTRDDVSVPVGSFTATPSGLVINATTGEVNLATSTPGVLYTITYTTAGDCPTSSTFGLTIRDFDDATFDYLSDTYCQSDANPVANIIGDAGGTFTAPPGLILADAATGEINLATSTPGTYNVTYTTTGTCPVGQDVAITIVGNQSAAFSYSSSTFCADGNDPQPQPGYVTGGTFSTTDPIAVDADNGTIDVSASTVGGPYTITYTIGSGSCQSVESFEISITNTSDATFSYDNTSYCIGAGIVDPIMGAGASIGTFSASSANLVIDATTGQIDVDASQPGTYTVTNFISGGGSCPDASFNRNVQIATPEVANITYVSPFCQSDATDPLPTYNSSTTGGKFTSSDPANFVVDEDNGQIDLDASQPGSYTITYTTPGACGATQDIPVTIDPATDASFSYPTNQYCKGDGSTSPNAGFATPGEFSVLETGLVFVGGGTTSADGEIDLDNSDAGTYTVVYQTTAPGCNGRETFTVIINEVMADAGLDANGCSFTHILQGSDPVGAGTGGEWTVVNAPSGTATATFDNYTDPNTEVRVNELGIYTFRWTVRQGTCLANDEVDITFVDTFTVTGRTGVSGANGCGQMDGFFIANPLGGSGTFSFDWSDSEAGNATPLNGESRNNLPAGVHSVRITDDILGCDTLLVFQIGNSGLDGNVSIAPTATSCDGGDTGEAEVAITGTDGIYTITVTDANGDTGAPITYDNQNGTAVATITGLAQGEYSLEIEGPDTNGDNCKTGRIVTIGGAPPISVAFDGSTEASCVGANDGSIGITVTGGDPSDTFSWKDSNGIEVSTDEDPVLTGGDYTVDITYGGGACTGTFGPYNVYAPSPAPGPTAQDPVITTIQCNSFEARWSNESVPEYRIDVATDIDFTSILPAETNQQVLGSTTYTVGGLTAGTDYFYRVRSVDNNGCISLNSNVIQVTTDNVIAPVAGEATDLTCEGFTAHWSAMADAIEYDLEVIDGSNNTVATYPNISAGTTTQPVDGLSGGETYQYYVKVRTACGESLFSNGRSVTTLGTTETITIQTTDATCEGAAITWDAVNGVTTYTVETYTDPARTVLAQTRTVNTTDVTLIGLNKGTMYYFTVTAQFPCSTIAANGEFETDADPDAPTNVVADASCDELTLQWDAVAGASGYEVDINITGTPLFVTDANATFGGLSQGQLYSYRVRTSDGCGFSAYVTGDITTDDTPAAPTNVTADGAACNGFTVRWDAVDGATEYIVQASADGFATTEEMTVTSPEATFISLMVATDYEYRVAATNGCTPGSSPFSAAGTMSTSPEENCGCGFDKATFVVDPVNENCPNSQDGALLVNLLPNVSTSPARFRYRYSSVTDPTNASADWETGANGPGLVWAASDLPAGDYVVEIQDINATADCDPMKSFNVTIRTQNEITTVTKAETCDALGEVAIIIPATCTGGDRSPYTQVIGSDGSEQTNNDGSGQIIISELPAGDYQIKVLDFIETDVVYATLPVAIANNCSPGGTDTTTVCNLDGGVTFLPETTLAECETGEGSVTFTAINDTDETFTFTVIEEGGVVFDTKQGTSGITFENLPSRRYTYEIYDALSQFCRGKFTVGTKSVSFEATPAQTITCDDVVTQIDVAIDADATLAAGPYEVFLVSQTDTIAQTNLPLGSLFTSFPDVPVGSQYGVIVRPAAADACAIRKTVDTNPPGTTAIQFTYQLDSTSCFQTRGGGAVTINNIVVSDNEPFTAYLYRVDLGEAQEYASRKFSTAPQSIYFEDIENGDYQIRLVQQQSGCVSTTQEKRSQTITFAGPTHALTASVRSFVEVTVNYPYGTIEIDSIGNPTKEGAPYEVRIAADPTGASTEWIEIVNDNPLARPYRHEYRDRPVGSYLVEVRDRFGCTNTYAVEVGYTSDLYIPNIFTPNGDGENDTFYILNLEDYGEDAGIQMKISNRWGMEVYRSPNYTNVEAWDGGTYPDGVYYYYLVLPDNTEHTGWLEIWRGRTP